VEQQIRLDFGEEVNMSRFLYGLLGMVVFGGMAFSEQDSVIAELPTEEAVVTVQFHPGILARSKQIAVARELYSQFSSRIAELSEPRIRLDLLKYQPGRPGKGFSSSGPMASLTCAVVIRLSTDSKNRFWQNSLLVAQIVDTIERLDEERKNIQWNGPEYRLANLENARKALYDKASSRLVDSWQVVEKAKQLPNETSRIDRCSFGEVSVVGSDISSVQLRLPFESSIGVK
jgi:hypothetical protein